MRTVKRIVQKEWLCCKKKLSCEIETSPVLVWRSQMLRRMQFLHITPPYTTLVAVYQKLLTCAHSHGINYVRSRDLFGTRGAARAPRTRTSRSPDTQMPIYGHMWHGLTQSLTHSLTHPHTHAHFPGSLRAINNIAFKKKDENE